MYSIEHINNEIKIKPQDITLFLAKPDKTKIAKLKHVSGKLLTIKSQETNQLSFNVPYWVDIDHKLVKNPHIDKFKEKYLIEANFNNKTEWFVINSIVKTSEESDDLQISCMSLEYLLNYRYMVEYENTGNCLMLTNDTLKGTGFKVGYINPKFNLMYRRFEITRQTKLATIYQIAETFGAIVRFDTVNMTVNFYTEDEIYQYKGFSIGYGKYIQNIEEKIDPDEIVTRLYVFGSNGMSINGVNPTGQSYIDDFSYFLYPFEMDDEGNVIQSSEYMSDDLAKALVLYNKYVSERKDLFSNYLNEKRELQIQKTEKENQLSDLELELQIILDAIVIAKANNQPTKELTQQRNNLNKEINKIKNEINSIDEKINRIDENIEKLREDLRYESHLTEEQLEELQNFIHEAEFTDENLFDETELYEAGLQEIKRVNTPPITINTSLINFFKIISERHNWDRFNVDDIIRINHERLGTDIKIKLNEFQIDFDNNDIDVVATNNDFIDNVDDKISRLFYTIDKVDTEQRKRKINWEKVAYNFNLRNDRIEDKPTNPTNAIITHKENDDGSVNLILKWDYPDFNKTRKNADNIDGFTIFLHADEDNEPYQFGSNMGEEVIVSEIPYTSRTYVFPSVPANLFYTVGIKAYRRVDEDINFDGILFSDLIVFKSGGAVSANTFQTFSTFSTMQNNEDGDDYLTHPYQPSEDVNIRGRINGYRIVPSFDAPSNPESNMIWVDLAKGQVKVWDGSKWSGDLDLEELKDRVSQQLEYLDKVEKDLNEKIDKSTENIGEEISSIINDLRRIEENVHNNINQVMEATKIPESDFPPEEPHSSGLWIDTSQFPPRMMKYDPSIDEYVPLALNEQEIQEMMNKIVDKAKTESLRYSKLDILKVRKKLNERIDAEISNVTQGIQDLLDVKEDLIQLANDIEDILDEYEGQYSSFKHIVDDINGRISTAIQNIDRIDDTVEAHSLEIEANAQAIQAKLDYTTYQIDKEGIITSIENNTSQINALATEIELRVTKQEYETDLEGINERISSAEATLQIHADAIEAKVDYSELVNYVDYQTYNEKISQLTTSIDGINASVESIEANVDGITGDITSINSQISSLNIAVSGITTTVESLETDLQTAQQSISQVEQTANSITSIIQTIETAVGENLDDYLIAVHSTIEQLPDEINLAISEGLANLDVANKNLIPHSSEYWDNPLAYILKDTHEIESDTTYTFTDYSSEDLDEISIALYDENDVHIRSITIGSGETVQFTTANNEVKFRVIVMSDDDDFIKKLGVAYKFKLEKGSVATEWSWADEDQVNKTNILSSINLSTEGVKIQGDKIDLVGLVTALNEDGSAGTMIHGSKLITGSVTADQIASNAITTEKLHVLARNLVNNFSNSKSLTGWGNYSGNSWYDDPEKGLCLRIHTDGNVMVRSSVFEVNPNQTYKFSFSIRAINTGGAIHFGFYAYDSEMNRLESYPIDNGATSFGTPTDNQYFWSVSVSGTTSWIDFEGYVASASSDARDIPYGKNVVRNFRMHPKTRYLQFRFLNYYNNGTARSVLYHSPSVIPVDSGTIHANNIVANNLSAISANLGNITAGNISGVNITGSTIRQQGTQGSITMNNQGLSFVKNSGYALRLRIDNDGGLHGDDMSIIFGNSSGAVYGSISYWYTDLIIDSSQGIVLQGRYDPVTIRIQNNISTSALTLIGGGITANGVSNFYDDVDVRGKLIARGFLYTDAWENNPRGTGLHLYARPQNGGEFRVTTAGSTSAYQNLRANWVITNTMQVHSASNIYLRPPASGEARVTAENTTDTYRPIRASSFPTSSSILTKTNHEELTIEEALYVLNQTDIWKYHIKNNVDAGIYDKQKVGVFSETVPALIRDEDGIDTYSMVSILWRIVQEQQKRIEQLERDRDEMYELI